jgi:hypothetical protein
VAAGREVVAGVVMDAKLSDDFAVEFEELGESHGAVREDGVVEHRCGVRCDDGLNNGDLLDGLDEAFRAAREPRAAFHATSDRALEDEVFAQKRKEFLAVPVVIDASGEDRIVSAEWRRVVDGGYSSSGFS